MACRGFRRYDKTIRRLLPAFLILAAVLTFFRTVLFVEGHTLPWDFRGFHLPLATAYADSLAEGVLPLWEPYAYCGRPLAANPQTAVFHPAMALAAMGGRAGLLERLEWSAVLQVALAGWLTTVLAARLGLGFWPSTLAGLMFALGGFTASQAQHWSALAALPPLVLGWLGLVVEQRWRVPTIAAAFAWSFLCGFPALTLASAASVMMLAVVLRSGVRDVLAAALVSLAVCGVQLIPTLDLVSRSVGKFRYEWLNEALDVPPVALLSLVWPNHLDVFDLSRYRAPYQLTSVYLFSSVTGLVLAVWGAWRARRDPWRAVAIGGAVFMILMFGQRTAVGLWLSRALPDPVRNVVYWQLFMAPFLLALSLLAGMGCSRFPRFGAVLAIAAAVECIAISSNRPMNLVRIAGEPLVTADAVDGDSGSARTLRRAVGGGRFDTADDGPHVSGMAPILRLRAANGYDPLALERLIRFRMTFSDGARWGAYQQVRDVASRVPAMAGVGALLSRSPVEGGRWYLAADLPGRKLYTDPQPRYWLVGRVHDAKDMEDAARRLAGIDPAREAVAEGMSLDSTARGTLRVTEESRLEVRISVECDGPLFLATAEAHDPGWRAAIDGARTQVYYTNVAFRGVPIPAGRHVVELRYDGWRVLGPGLALSGIGLAVWLGLAIRARRG